MYVCMHVCTCTPVLYVAQESLCVVHKHLVLVSYFVLVVPDNILVGQQDRCTITARPCGPPDHSRQPTNNQGAAGLTRRSAPPPRTNV